MGREPDDHHLAEFLTCKQCGKYFGDDGLCDCADPRDWVQNLDWNEMPAPKMMGSTICSGLVQASHAMPGDKSAEFLYGILVTALATVILSAKEKETAQLIFNAAIKEAAALVRNIEEDDDE